jgi:hypothetical protein
MRLTPLGAFIAALNRGLCRCATCWATALSIHSNVVWSDAVFWPSIRPRGCKTRPCITYSATPA